MPTYEYECKACGQRFERFQHMRDDPVKVCPHCGAPVKRLIGLGGGFIFKGTGFYATDYGGPQPRCGREKPCCGREAPCEKKPCE
ncbi:MAG: zinc ribbon domain-containing protein [Deltaproteobacteria bacterium]|nr:zinc ribbon domain-containing protein [Deltaproteobacteria bacterium]